MKKYIKNESIISENVGLKENDDVMLYNQVTEDVYVINSTAYEVFSELSIPRSDVELYEILKQRYSITEDSILYDVQNILTDFTNKGLVGIVNEVL